MKFAAYSGLGILAVLVVIAMTLLFPLAYALGGFITGWVLVVVFPFAGNWVVNGANAIGAEISLDALPHIGAALGFVGAFFKSSQTNMNESK